jgi:hypothetical protein
MGAPTSSTTGEARAEGAPLELGEQDVPEQDALEDGVRPEQDASPSPRAGRER